MQPIKKLFYILIYNQMEKLKNYFDLKTLNLKQTRQAIVKDLEAKGFSVFFTILIDGEKQDNGEYDNVEDATAFLVVENVWASEGVAVAWENDGDQNPNGRACINFLACQIDNRKDGVPSLSEDIFTACFC